MTDEQKIIERVAFSVGDHVYVRPDPSRRLRGFEGVIEDVQREYGVAHVAQLRGRRRHVVVPVSFERMELVR